MRDGKFNVSYETAGETYVLLPSLWNTFVHEGISVRISFGADPNWRRPQSSSTDKEVEILDVGVDVGNRSETGPASGTNSWNEVTSVQNSDDDTGGSDVGESDTESETDEEVVEVPTAEPVRITVT